MRYHREAHEHRAERRDDRDPEQKRRRPCVPRDFADGDRVGAHADAVAGASVDGVARLAEARSGDDLASAGELHPAAGRHGALEGESEVVVVADAAAVVI